MGRLIDADDFIKRFRYGEEDQMAKAMGVSLLQILFIMAM